jgi:SOS-response transcriptional repressor LexA
MKAITAKQKEVLNYIKSHLCEHHSTPTMFEITDHFKWESQNSAQEFVAALQRKGYVCKTGRGKKIKINNCVLTLEDDD